MNLKSVKNISDVDTQHKIRKHCRSYLSVERMEIETYLNALLQALIALLPKIGGAAIVLIIGWAVGRVLGKGISKVLVKVRLDEALRKTVIGKALERSGITGVRLFDLVIRWFVYLIAILTAADILNISELSTLLRTTVAYLPSLVAGFFIIIVGFIVSDFIGDVMKGFGEEMRIEYSGLFANALKLFLYFIVIVIALTTMKIDVSILYVFANALAWGIAIGLCVGLGIALGLGFKDVVARNAERWIETAQSAVKRAEDFWSWYRRKEGEKE